MSVERRGNRWRVRYREGTRQRTRTFDSRANAEAFDWDVRRERQIEAGNRVLGADPLGFTGTPVYVIRGGSMVKIGKSFDPLKRLAYFQTGSALRLELLYIIESADGDRLEAILHERFAKHRMHGEWFDAEPVLEDLGWLARVGFCRFSRAPQVPEETVANGAA